MAIVEQKINIEKIYCFSRAEHLPTQPDTQFLRTDNVWIANGMAAIISQLIAHYILRIFASAARQWESRSCLSVRF